MKKCIIVWGEIQVGFDGARAFVPIQEYPLGLGDAADEPADAAGNHADAAGELGDNNEGKSAR